jgi:FGGY-family pentulose kinase
MPDLVIAVDVGSSSARAGVFDKQGLLLARAETPFATAHPQPDHAEHSSDEIWAAVCHAVRGAVTAGRIAAEEVKGIAFDATCSLVTLDSAGQPVTASVTGEDRWNVIMWADHRAATEAEEITATNHRVLDHVGNVMSPEMEVPKLLWLKRHCRDAWRRYGLVLDLTDFLTWKATGRPAVSTCTVTCKWTYLAHEKPGWQSDFLSRVGSMICRIARRFPPRRNRSERAQAFSRPKALASLVYPGTASSASARSMRMPAASGCWAGSIQSALTRRLP